jgi:hypothetical protein
MRWDLKWSQQQQQRKQSKQADLQMTILLQQRLPRKLLLSLLPPKQRTSSVHKQRRLRTSGLGHHMVMRSAA